MIKRLHSNLFLVSNLKNTAEFYEKLGFSIQKTSDAVRIKIGDFTLAFMDEKQATITNESGASLKGLGIYTYIEVDDADKYYEFTKNKNIHSTEPKTWPWGKREFVIKDPDGYKLVFYSSIK